MKSRESGFELLRLICMFGIITIHTFGSFYNSATGINLVYGVLINSAFNMGVSLFMLISGYYGVSFSWKKAVHLEMTAIFYSVVNLLVLSYIAGALSKKALVRACFPMSEGNYWYISCYMLILLFSPFLNQIPEKLKKKDFEKLIGLMLLLFCILPSIVQSHILGDDGKGVLNMLLMYFMGRYLRIYGKPSYAKGKMFGLGCLGIISGFALNYALSLLFNKGQGLYAPFARDCSFTIVLGSIGFFLFFRELKFQSKLINVLAKYVIGMYLFEGTFRAILRECIDITVYGQAWYLFAVLLVYVAVTMAACIIIELFRSATLGRLEDVVTAMIKRCIKEKDNEC